MRYMDHVVHLSNTSHFCNPFFQMKLARPHPGPVKFAFLLRPHNCSIMLDFKHVQF